jgi:hypothetical protein
MFSDLMAMLSIAVDCSHDAARGRRVYDEFVMRFGHE